MINLRYYFCSVIFLAMTVLLIEPVIAEYELLKDKNSVVRMNEAQRLGNEGIKEAVPYLIELLKDESVGVRINAIVALGQLGDERAIEPLIEVMNNDNSKAPRIMAAQALGRFHENRVNDALLNAADNEDETVSSAAIISLGRSGGEKEVKKLIKKAKKDKNPKIRADAVNALADIVEMGNEGEGKGEEIKEILNDVKKDKDKKVRDSAKKALKRLKKVPNKEK